MSSAADSIKHFTTDSGTFLLKNIFEVTTISLQVLSSEKSNDYQYKLKSPNVLGL